MENRHEALDTDDFYCEYALTGKVEIEVVEETERVLAFHHTRPHWPVHIVVIPKTHVDSLVTLTDDVLMKEMMAVIKRVAKKVTEDCGAARVLTNLGDYQDSKHLHWHICSGDPAI
jgi:histidine triad (HIT) family protein